MNGLLRVLFVGLVLLVIFLCSAFLFYQETTKKCNIPPEPGIVSAPSCLLSRNLVLTTYKEIKEEEPAKYTKGKYMCHVAVAIYTAPAHKGTRVQDAAKSWTKRICADGTYPFLFSFLALKLLTPC